MVSRIPSQGGQILDVLVNSQATPALCHVIQNNTFINTFRIIVFSFVCILKIRILFHEREQTIRHL